MLNRYLDKFRKDQDGVSFVIFVLSLPFILAFLALAIDMSYAYFTRAKLQTIASSAALAAASQLDPAVALAQRKANARTEANLYADTKNPGLGHAAEASAADTTNHGVTNHITADEDIIFGHWDDDRDPEFLPDTTAGFDESVTPYNAVKVFARRDGADTLPLFLGFSLPQTDVNTYAIATAFGGVDQEICLLALDVSDPAAFYINGSNNIFADKCGICSNGGITGNGSAATVKLTDGETIYNRDSHGLNNESKIADIFDPFPRPEEICVDPFANLDPFPDHWDDPCIPNSELDDSNYDPNLSFGDPIPGGGTYMFPFSKEPGLAGGIDLVVNPTPGFKLCGTVKANNNFLEVGKKKIFHKEDIETIVLAPGLHHLGSSDGTIQDINFNGSGKIPVVGTDVTILLTNVQLDWLGSSQDSLSAPSDLSGPGFNATDSIEGIGHLIHQNPHVPGPDDPILKHELGGSNGSVFDGLIYTGLYSDFKFHGNQNTGATGVCLTAIAGSFEFKGTTGINLSSDCAASVPLAQSDLIVRLQE